MARGGQSGSIGQATGKPHVFPHNPCERPGIKRPGIKLKLKYIDQYKAHGLNGPVLDRLALLGDFLRGASFNVTGIRDCEEIERLHFLDSLSLLDLRWVREARRIVDIGSGAGLPALVLALVLPESWVVALESQRKKCAYIARAVDALGLRNIVVHCERAEEYGRGAGREAHDVAVSRAVSSLPVVAEYSIPLLVQGGLMVAMKGAISDQERTRAEKALGILGAEMLGPMRLVPFEGAENRWAYLARKVRATPDRFPRRPGVPSKRPLGL